MNEIISQLTISNRLEYLGPVVAYIRELAKVAGFNEEEIWQIRLAVEEAVTNVIRHGLEMNPGESFRLICKQSATELQIRIQEKGVPFDPANAPKYSPEHALEDASGLGTFLMKASMDEVTFHNLGRQGKELVLTKRLKEKRVDMCFRPEELTPFLDTTPTRIDSAPTYQIRKLQPQEAIEVSRCAYRAYGYTYDDYIYYPEKIVEYNKNGMMVSLVAVTDEGELMGHTALKFPFPKATIAEFGVTFVKPKFRKMGLFGALGMHAVKIIPELSLNGVFGREALSHPISQKMAADFGLIDCGIMLGMFPDDIEFKNLVGKVRQRECVVISFIHLSEKKQITIYPPEEHREMVERIYVEMNVPYLIGLPEAPASEIEGGDTNILSSKSNFLNTADIMVRGFNKETLAELKELLHNYCIEKTDVIYLYLNMEDPHCGVVAQQCSKLGFIFCGLLPEGIFGRQALILQYLNNLEMDLDQITPYSKTAQDILNYIKRADQ